MKSNIDAGEFEDWLNSFMEAMEGKGAGDVPCGDCVGCCTSSKFVLVRPTDKLARKAIPKELLFPAPGLSKGFDLLGYNEDGHCPMFKNGKCSIYNSRPETCKQYDCRALSATEASTKGEGSAISDRISSWNFSYDNQRSLNKSKSLKSAMKFLKQNSEYFPEGYLPPSESQKAAVAVRVHKEFYNSIESSGTLELVTKIVSKYPVGDR